MDTAIERTTRAAPHVVLGFAAAVEDWPRLLPHYRMVRVLADDGAGHRTVEMAARRLVVAPLGVPLHWIARQSIWPNRVEFEHIGGLTRGMAVAWTYEPLSQDQTVIRIRHIFQPRWPVPDALIGAVVGDYFVNAVARLTLRRLCDLAEVRTRGDATTT